MMYSTYAPGTVVRPKLCVVHVCTFSSITNLTTGVTIVTYIIFMLCNADYPVQPYCMLKQPSFPSTWRWLPTNVSSGFEKKCSVLIDIVVL